MADASRRGCSELSNKRLDTLATLPVHRAMVQIQERILDDRCFLSGEKQDIAEGTSPAKPQHDYDRRSLLLETFGYEDA